MTCEDWILACMVPFSSLMHCILKEDDTNKCLIQAKFIQYEIGAFEGDKRPETEIEQFLEAGITDILREGILFLL